MGCNVPVPIYQLGKRGDQTLLTSLIQVGRGIIFLGLALSSPMAGFSLFVLALIEFLGARWLWSLRIEAWGVVTGICFFHFLYPIASIILESAGWSILLLCIAQLILLAMARMNGLYSFETIASIDPEPLRIPTAFQRNVFSLVVIAQLFKAGLVLLTGAFMLTFLDPTSNIPWLPFVPVMPLVFFLGIVDSVAALGIFTGRDWAFQLTLLMCPIGFVETILTLSAPVLLISPWIVMLLTTCIAKDGFYFKLQKRRKKSHPQELVVLHD